MIAMTMIMISSTMSTNDMPNQLRQHRETSLPLQLLQETRTNGAPTVPGRPPVFDEQVIPLGSRDTGPSRGTPTPAYQADIAGTVVTTILPFSSFTTKAQGNFAS